MKVFENIHDLGIKLVSKAACGENNYVFCFSIKPSPVMYNLQIRHGQLNGFQVRIFLMKRGRLFRLLRLSGIIFQIFGPRYPRLSVPHATVFIFVVLKIFSLGYLITFFKGKTKSIIFGDKRLTTLYNSIASV